jgi:hypothetical protein
MGSDVSLLGEWELKGGYFVRARGGGVFWAAAAFRRGWPAKIRPGPGWPKIVYRNRGAFAFGSFYATAGQPLAALRGCKFAYHDDFNGRGWDPDLMAREHNPTQKATST